jgi:hypothetical protein
MPINVNPEDLIRRKVEKRTKDPAQQDLMIKLIQDNPQLEGMILNYDLDSIKNLQKILSGSPASASSSPVTQRTSHRSDFSSGSPSSYSSSPISSGGSGSSGGCFIATAAYGSPFAKNVVVLSSFRDQYLQRSSFGRAFITFYYSNSPRIADFISGKPLPKKIIRILLMPFIWFCKHLDN